MACCALIAAVFGLIMSIGATLLRPKKKPRRGAQSWRLERENDDAR